jgi:hypothetical protein
VPAPSPPVPQVSIRGFVAVTTLTHFARMARAQPAISPAVSPFILSAVAKAPICTGVASPNMISCITASASPCSRSALSTSLAMASLIISYPCPRPSDFQRSARHTASSRTCILLNVSWYSLIGSESATIPAPPWR